MTVADGDEPSQRPFSETLQRRPLAETEQSFSGLALSPIRAGSSVTFSASLVIATVSGQVKERERPGR